MKYYVVNASSLENSGRSYGLITLVQQLIEKGYVPCGGICIDSDPHVFYQAMIKEEKHDPFETGPKS